MLLRIKELRKLKKLSQQDLADLTGFSVRMIIDYEKPGADIPLKKMQVIADSLKVSIADLLPESVNSEMQMEVSEPTTHYGNVRDLIDSKNQIIDLLTKENNDLRIDKEFYREILKSKLL